MGFVRKVVYSKTKENYIQTRIRLYKSSTSKSTTMIPPVPDSLLQAIKRVHYQVFIWLRSHEANINSLRYQEFGWKWCDEGNMLWPVWFTGLQIPPELKRTRTVRDYAADAADEADKEDLTHPKAKRSLPTKSKKVKKQKRENKEELSDNYDEDEETVTEDVGCTSDESDEEVEINEKIFTSEESDWEVSDFLSSDSAEEWTQ